MTLARDAAAAGDTIEMENCYQYAEHFLRVMQERAAVKRQVVIDDEDDELDELPLFQPTPLGRRAS